jgi:thiol-disulfide isomerase/thioredoxin
VSSAALRDGTLVAFLSPSCPGCERQLPDFVGLAAEQPMGRAQVLAVVVDSDGESGALRAELAPVARMVVEEPDGPLGKAFSVRGYPAFGRLAANGTVLASGLRLEDVR